MSLDTFNIYYHEKLQNDKIVLYKFHAFNSCSFPFKTDAGASITIINEETMNLVKRKPAVNVVSLVSWSSKMYTYSVELIKPLGKPQ